MGVRFRVQGFGFKASFLLALGLGTADGTQQATEKERGALNITPSTLDRQKASNYEYAT